MKKILCLFLVSLVVHTVWAQSGVGYDPENPGDPDVYYRLTLEAAPRSGGEVSTYNSKMVAAGTEVYCYASAKTGYTFSRWMKGDVVVSTESSFTYTMPEENVTLTAYFDFTGYNPDSPDDPFADGYQHKVTLYATPRRRLADISIAATLCWQRAKPPMYMLTRIVGIDSFRGNKMEKLYQRKIHLK